MDKLSEHAIRMLEIEGKGKNDGYIETRNMGDIARAVYDTILQVQMLKMADRKESGIPTSSEKPNNCETCKHDSKEWYEDPCGWCCGAHSGYEPKTEPHHSGEVTEMVEPQTVYEKKCGGGAVDPIRSCYPELFKDEPQTMYYPQVDGITPSVIKTEPTTEDSSTVDWKDQMWKEAVKTEPQTEREGE